MYFHDMLLCLTSKQQQQHFVVINTKILTTNAMAATRTIPVRREDINNETTRALLKKY